MPSSLRTPTEAESARLALAAVVGATGATPDGIAMCQKLMERACEGLRVMPDAALTGAGAEPTSSRLNAVAVLAVICASCRACHHGQDMEEETAGTAITRRPQPARLHPMRGHPMQARRRAPPR